jgi:hypothetical protein
MERFAIPRVLSKDVQPRYSTAFESNQPVRRPEDENQENKYQQHRDHVGGWTSSALTRQKNGWLFQRRTRREGWNSHMGLKEEVLGRGLNDRAE